jgi:uroporphyrinogen-III synthase
MQPIVVVTASPGSFPDLAAHLSNFPVVVEERPLISFEPPKDWTGLDAALADLVRFESVALTSPRAARALADRMRQRRTPDRTPGVWAVGSATAQALGTTLGPVRILEGLPGKSPAAALARAMLDSGCRGPVLFPCGERHREDLPAILRAGGCEVEEVVCYRSLLAPPEAARAAAARASIIVVGSPSVMKLLADNCLPSTRPQLIAIGPTTANAGQVYGWTPAAVAQQPSSPSIASAISSLLIQQNR